MRTWGFLLAFVSLSILGGLHEARACGSDHERSVGCERLGDAGDRLVILAEAQKKSVKREKKDGPSAKQAEFKERKKFTREQQNLAAISGMPDARFWGDSPAAFKKALPSEPGPWLALSSGGSAGAFGAGLLSGLTESGKRPDYKVVTGISTGALIGVYAFLGPRYDDKLLENFTKITPADIFTDTLSPESLLDTWPLKKSIEKRVDSKLVAEVAAEHQRGRRLFIVTANLDAGRPVVWNMGAIAAYGGERALHLFREVLFAASAVEGVFPPVLIDVEAKGERFQEMHGDGGVFTPFYIAPASLLLDPNGPAIPATELYAVINSKLDPEFEVIERDKLAIIGQVITIWIKTSSQAAIAIAEAAAARAGIGFHVAYVDAEFNFQAKALFDEKYMKALWDLGVERGRSADPFRAPARAATVDR
jgi:hypothetical protein